MEEIKTTPYSKVNKNNIKCEKTKGMLYYVPIRGKIKKCPERRMENDAILLSAENDKSEQINDISLKEGVDKYVLIIHEKDINIKNNLVKKKQYAYYPPKKESLTFKRMGIGQNIKKHTYPKNGEKKNFPYFKQKIEKEQNNFITCFDKKKKKKEKKIKENNNEKNSEDNNDSSLKSINYRNDLFDNILRKIKRKKNKLKEKAINEKYTLIENKRILEQNESQEIQTDEAISVNNNRNHIICKCDLVNTCNENISYYGKKSNRWLLERDYTNEIYKPSKKNHELNIDSKHYRELKQTHCENCKNCKSNTLKYSKQKDGIMYIKVDNNFFNSNKSSELEGPPYVTFDRYNKDGENATPSKLNKFFFIFCNGCLVVFLGVSNNICGRMRNRILKNFDSLTASYNAIAYVIIYSFLCMLFIKFKHIRKEHWLYIYPCLKNYFFKQVSPNKKKQNENIELLKNEEIGHERNYLVEIKSNEKIKKAKKIMNFFHHNKKNTLHDDFISDNSSDESNKYDGKEYDKVINKSANCERCPTCNSVIKMEEKRYKDNKKHKVYNTNEQCRFSKDEMKHLLQNEEYKKSEKNMYKIDNGKYLKKSEHNNWYNMLTYQWSNMGAYKYVVIVSILDIVSNTLYFVSQLAIPLTILLLLNQLNFIFSIILSYLILKREYNRHHAISVIIVLTGFLFFYVPYIYNDNTNFLQKKILTNYYINSNSFINPNHFNIFGSRNLDIIDESDDSLNLPPFGLISSIMLCIFSIVLTSYGGILREIFFYEYVKQRKEQNKLMDNQTSLEETYLYAHDIKEMDQNGQANDLDFPVLYKKDGKSKKCKYCNKKNKDELIEYRLPLNNTHNINRMIDEREDDKYEYATKNIKEPRVLKKMSVVLLSFNIALIQILLLPIISYFQFLFNPSNKISYLLYIKDSVQCFAGITTENNENCKFSLLIYVIYIIVNVLFNLSVSYFYSNYSSAECFLILKSSTPLTLVVLYFYDFPFISDSDKYFSVYFVISIFIVFTGVSYFFYQNIATEKEEIKPGRRK
ncbi:conserved Plasmodium protein, unknown function [Plasmodium vinckei vinckei]|uniref:Transporter n=1 Tax=Plasmodium vinckei vinckei TaxID=54757 RepID=A0A449BSP3_PLAVN|nr:conserved Plasmodium protein, unknown function [Plasmodium vinckei vinckei]VEV56500.1 conserved Plasmodium protein, unknown function [Plasmodium vinckei vinckei]